MEYDSCKKYMKDYRMGLLSEFIEVKLGLCKRKSKGDSLVNALIYDITKDRKVGGNTIDTDIHYNKLYT